MFIESGLIVFVGLILLGIKLPRKTALKLLNYPLTIDLTVTVLMYMLHWGTFTGVMAAAVAGLLTSGFTSMMRWTFGYIDRKGVHTVGWWVIKVKAVTP